MHLDTFMELLYSHTLLLSLGVLYLFLPINLSTQSLRMKITNGLVLALIGTIVIWGQLQSSEGMILDSRTILLSVGAIYLGFIPTLVAVVIMSIVRLLIGGGTPIIGVAILTASAVIGFLWKRFLPTKRRPLHLLLFGLLVHINLLLWLSLIPSDYANTLITQAVFPGIIIYPFTTMLLGMILERQQHIMTTREVILFDESKLGKILENSWDIVLLIDAYGVCNYINKSVTRILGYQSEEVIGKSINLWIHPDHLELVQNSLEKMVSKPGFTETIEIQLRHKDGHYIWVENVTSNLLHDPSIRSIIAHARDITDRKKSAKELLDWKELTDYAILHDPNAIAILDKDLNFIFASERFLGNVCKTAGDIIGKYLCDALPDISDYFKTAYQRALAGEIVSNEEYPIFNPDGSVDISRWEVRPWFKSDSSIGGVIIYSEIYTDKKKAEESYGAVIKTSLDGFHIVDLHGVIHDANETMCNMLGYTREELLTKTIFDFDPLQTPEAYHKLISRIRETGRARFSTRHLRKDGSSYEAEISSTFLDVDGGRFFSFARDITDRMSYEKRIFEESERLANIIEATRAGTWERDIETNEVRFNDRWFQMMGYTSDELNPLTFEGWIELIHPDDVENAQVQLQRHLEGISEAYETEIRLRHKDGSYKWILSRGKIIERDEKGNPKVLAGIHLDISESKQHEQEQLLLANLMENSQSEIFVLDGKTLYLARINKSALANLQYTHKELKGKSPTVFLPEFTDDTFRETMQPLLRGDVTELKVITRHQRKDKTEYDIEANLTYDKAHDLFVSFVFDLTEQVRMREALQESEARYREIFHNSNDALFVTEVTPDLMPGHFIEVNDIACASLGYTREEFLRMTPSDITNETSLRVNLEDYAEYFRKNRQITSEATHIRKDGTSFPVELNTYMFKTQETYRTLTIARDISERKLAEQRERESRLVLLQAQSIANIGSYTYDLIDESFIFSDEALNIIGVNEELLNSLRLRDVVIPDEYDQVKSALLNLVHKKEPFDINFQIIRQNDKEQRFVRSVGRLDEQKNRIIGVIQDITEERRAIHERKHLEEELRQSQKMDAIGRLAGGVAHDFNNMLAVIMSTTEMILPEVDPESNMYKDLLEIDRAAQRSADLTRQLLTFSRKQIIRPKVVDLNDSIIEQHKMLKRLIGEDIEIRLGTNKELWPVFIDPTQINQILANLIVNARDAISGVGTVTINTDNVLLDEEHSRNELTIVAGDYVMVSVTDTGAGIPPEHLDRVFEPFFTTKKMGEGTGLGLSTIYGIVKQNNGVIHVYSEIDQGTTFKIYFPRFVGDETRTITASNDLPLTGDETILVVEDEDSILNVAKRFLELSGYTVLAARNPIEALETAKEFGGDIHLLLTDVVMPGMNGKQLEEQLNELQPDSKVLFMSGYSADVIAQRGILNEGIDFIQKPFTMKTLTEKVRSVLDNRN